MAVSRGTLPNEDKSGWGEDALAPALWSLSQWRMSLRSASALRQARPLAERRDAPRRLARSAGLCRPSVGVGQAGRKAAALRRDPGAAASGADNRAAALKRMAKLSRRAGRRCPLCPGR